MRAIVHGVDGWVLEDMEWDSKTGLASYLYAREIDGVLEEHEVVAEQPYRPTHHGWKDRPRVPQSAFALAGAA